MLAEEFKSTYVPGEEDFIDENGDPIKTKVSDTVNPWLTTTRSNQKGMTDITPDLKITSEQKESVRSKQLQKQKWFEQQLARNNLRFEKHVHKAAKMV